MSVIARITHAGQLNRNNEIEGPFTAPNFYGSGMSAGIGSLIQVIMSILVEAGGQTASRGGGGLLLSAARKIGWANQKDEKEGRLKGHKIGGHTMGSGFGQRRDLVNYNPKEDHKRRLDSDMNRGRRSGSDILKRQTKKNKPSHLFGRPLFEGTESISGNPQSRWIKTTKSRGSATPRPRSFIKTS